MAFAYTYQETTVPYRVGFHPVFVTMVDEATEENVLTLMGALLDHISSIIYSMNVTLEMEVPFPKLETIIQVIDEEAEAYSITLDESDYYRVSFTRGFCMIYLDLLDKRQGTTQRYTYVLDPEFDLEEEEEIY